MLNKKRSAIIVGLSVLLFTGLAQSAKPEGVGGGSKKESKNTYSGRWLGASRHKKDEDEKFTKKADKENRLFDDEEREEIRGYYRAEGETKHKNKGKKDKGKKDKGKSMPYGLQKKLERGGELPPGWQTKVARGEVLDQEILDHSERLPDALVRRLPELREGTEVRRVGDKVIRVMEGSGTVLDVIDLADIVLR